MYQRKRKFVCKDWALICHSSMLWWLVGIILAKIICILKLATYTKIADHYSGCKLATVLMGRDGQMFIFYFIYTKHQVLLIRNENKEICVANLMIKYRFFPLKNKYFGTFVQNGLITINCSTGLICIRQYRRWEGAGGISNEMLFSVLQTSIINKYNKDKIF